MSICEKCRYLYDITKDVRSANSRTTDPQIISLFEKYAEDKDILAKDIVTINPTSLFNTDFFNQMADDDKNKLADILSALDNRYIAAYEDHKKAVAKKAQIASKNIAYYICKFCGNYKKIESGTIIYSKNYNTNVTSVDEDYTYAIFDVTLPRTRNYVCKNTKCKSHTDESLKEAVIKKNSLYQIIYVCTACNSHWINTI